MAPDELPDDAALDALMRRLDHPVPTVTAEQVIARARAGRRTPWMRAAAVAAGLALFGGVAWAAPGSPVPAWIEAVVAGLGSVGGEATDGTEPPRRPDTVGIAVDATEGMVIRIVAGGAGGWLRVSTWADPTVEASSPTSSTSFSSDPEGLTITHAGVDTLRLRLPAGIPSVRVLVGSTEVFRTGIDGGVVTEAAGDGDGWLIPLGSRVP